VDSGSAYYLYPVSFSVSLAKKRKTVKVFVPDGFLIEINNISITYQLQAVRQKAPASRQAVLQKLH